MGENSVYSNFHSAQWHNWPWGPDLECGAPTNLWNPFLRGDTCFHWGYTFGILGWCLANVSSLEGTKCYNQVLGHLVRIIKTMDIVVSEWTPWCHSSKFQMKNFSVTYIGEATVKYIQGAVVSRVLHVSDVIFHLHLHGVAFVIFSAFELLIPILLGQSLNNDADDNEQEIMISKEK